MFDIKDQAVDIKDQVVDIKDHKLVTVVMGPISSTYKNRDGSVSQVYEDYFQ